MGKISNIDKEREIIGLFFLSRKSIDIAIEHNFNALDCVNKFNQNIIEMILSEATNNADYIPTVNQIADNFDEKEREKTIITLNRYKKMVLRDIVDDKQYEDIAINSINILRDLYIKRKVINALKNGLDKIELPARDFISSINKDLTSIEINDGEVTEVSIFTGFTEIKNEMIHQMEHGIEFGYKVNLRDVDEMLGDSIADGTYSLIVGRPSNYKTGVALNFALNMAENGIPNVVFSHEMSPKNCYRRILARYADIEMNRLKKPHTLSTAEWKKLDEAITAVNSVPLYIVDGSKLHIGQIDSVLAYMVSKYGIKVCWWDYFQLIRKRDGSIPTEERDFAEVSEELRMLPKKYNIAGIALSQANRDCEKRDDKRPTLKDIRSSGKAEMDSETVMYVYRDEFYHGSASELPNHLEIGMIKNREGDLKKCLLHFNGSKARLSNADTMILADKSKDYIGGAGLFDGM